MSSVSLSRKVSVLFYNFCQLLVQERQMIDNERIVSSIDNSFCTFYIFPEDGVAYCALLDEVHAAAEGFFKRIFQFKVIGEVVCNLIRVEIDEKINIATVGEAWREDRAKDIEMTYPMLVAQGTYACAALFKKIVRHDS